MAMNLFISWSGRRSRELAEAMLDWLPRLFKDDQIGELYLSSELDKGRPWFEQISKALADCHAALLCLTPEGAMSPWMHFEAGAIAKTLFSPKGDPLWQPANREPRVFTYLHQVRPGEVSGALAQYQATVANREDTRRLVDSLGRLSPVPVDEDVQGARFNELWPRLEEAIRSIRPLTLAEAIPPFEGRFRRKTFREPLAECTNQAWTDRHAGARETLSQLHDDQAIVERRCHRYHLELFRELVAEVDGYAMAISALLVGREPFELRDDGRLEVPIGIERACERRRLRIEEFVSRLLDPSTAPAYEESWQFVRAPTLEAKRSVLHRIKHEMSSWSDLRKAKTAGDLDSGWELDRIVAYLVCLDSPRPTAARDLLSAANSEINREYREDASRPPIALYYALGALEATLSTEALDREIRPGLQSLLARLHGPDAELVEECTEFQLREVLARLGEHLTLGADTSDRVPREPTAKAAGPNIPRA